MSDDRLGSDVVAAGVEVHGELEMIGHHIVVDLDRHLRRVGR